MPEPWPTPPPRSTPPPRPTPDPRHDLTRTTLAVLFIGGLLGGTLWVMRPFLPAIIWATTLVIATWPLMLRVQRHLGNRRSLAVVVMTVAVVLVLVMPFWLAISTIVENADEIADMVRGVLALKIPPPPDWLAEVPLVGPRASHAWADMTSAGMQELGTRLTPYAGQLTQWFASAAGSLGAMFVQLLLIVAIAPFMYARGEQAAGMAVRFGGRLGGLRGEIAVRLAGQAIRGVALGVVVTAAAQSLLGGIGLAVVGVPFAAVLTAVMFMLCVAQVGPGLVLFPAVLWMYSTSGAAWAAGLLAFSIVAVTMDNVLRPLLIRTGADLPLLLILAGVIGGLIAMGLLGIFVGPTLLAVAYTLLNAWMADSEEADGRAPLP